MPIHLAATFSGLCLWDKWGINFMIIYEVQSKVRYSKGRHNRTAFQQIYMHIYATDRGISPIGDSYSYYVGEVKVYNFLPQTHCYGMLMGLRVTPLYRRQGVASQLLDLCEDYAKMWKFEAIDLAVYAMNGNAINLYKKHGYHFDETSTFWKRANIQNWIKELK